MYNILETRPPPQIKVSIFENIYGGYPYEKKNIAKARKQLH